MSFQLSETLYPVDELIGTFIQCILMQSDIDECLFWLMELLYTTPNICEGIVSIYQQFYSNSNKNVEIYLTRKINDYVSSGDIRHIADIVYNLREMPSNPTAYYIVQYSLLSDSPSIIYKKPNLNESYPINMYGLFKSIKSKNISNIGVYAAKSIYINGFENTRYEIIKYADSNGIDITSSLCDTMCDKGIQTISYLISKILNDCQPPKNRFGRVNLDVFTKMKQHFETNKPNSYKKIKEKQLYLIHNFLPPLKYGRFTLDQDFHVVCRLHWEYYCFNSIAWNEQITRRGGVLDHNKRQITWSNNSHFNNDNCMDLDEETMNTSINVIEDPKIWYNLIMEQSVLNKITRMTLND